MGPRRHGRRGRARRPARGYAVVVVPELYLVRDEHAAVVAEPTSPAAGQAVVTFFSGIVDEDDRVRPRVPRRFRDLLGIRVDEFRPLGAGQTLALSDGTRAHTWSEPVELRGAEAVTTYAEGPLAGRRRHRNKSAPAMPWYVSTVLEDGARAALLRRVLENRGVAPDPAAEPGLEVVPSPVRRARVGLPAQPHRARGVAHSVAGHELVADRPVDGVTVLAAGGTQIIRTDRIDGAAHDHHRPVARTTRPTTPRRRPGGTRYRRAIAFFVLPFALLFAAFYLAPILYAVWESLQKIERQGTFGAPTQVFAA